MEVTRFPSGPMERYLSEGYFVESSRVAALEAGTTVGRCWAPTDVAARTIEARPMRERRARTSAVGVCMVGQMGGKESRGESRVGIMRGTSVPSQVGK